MKTIYLILSLLLISCGKPKDDGDFKADQILPRTVITQIPNQSTVRIKIFCYYSRGAAELVPAYMLKGGFYKGNFSTCDGEFKACKGRGIYVHYFSDKSSCLAKKGFEEQFTLCLDGRNPDELPSNVGRLVRMNLTIDTETSNLWCEKKILKIMLKENSEA